LRFPGQIVGIGHAATVYAARLILRQVHEAIGIPERKWTKQDGVNRAKDRGIRADAQCESEDAHRRGERIAQELPKGKAKVLARIFE
jgi:hypothetical protein